LASFSSSDPTADPTTADDGKVIYTAKSEAEAEAEVQA